MNGNRTIPLFLPLRPSASSAVDSETTFSASKDKSVARVVHIIFNLSTDSRTEGTPRHAFLPRIAGPQHRPFDKDQSQ